MCISVGGCLCVLVRMGGRARQVRRQGVRGLREVEGYVVVEAVVVVAVVVTAVVGKVDQPGGWWSFSS